MRRAGTHWSRKSGPGGGWGRFRALTCVLAVELFEGTDEVGLVGEQLLP